ncbi:MAG: sulfite exporter TauE/SafE family protein [Gammaproteobacteria bacterium]|nr:sulfite exporter TauE/SafE family protein [Gammaproteobacteria bacterium]
MFIAALVGAFLAFTLSASAGLGGSLVLIPILVLFLGAKQGVALAALLLAANNIAKVIVYRQSIPWRAAAVVIVLTMAGAWLGAILLIAVDEIWVQLAVAATIAMTFIAERATWTQLQRLAAPVLALLAGTASGFSGTSGPLKGVALRNLRLSRQYLVGAASAVSLAGDVTKTMVFLHASLLSTEMFWLFAAAVPLMPLATLLGKRINRRMGERAYTGLFWTVMAGYTVRLLGT